MDTTEITVTLPSDLVDEIEKRVASGVYSSASDVAQAGLLTLFADQEHVEH